MGGLSRRVRNKKGSFLKKEQKTFVSGGGVVGSAGFRARREKVFLPLFLQKKKNPSFPGRRLTPERTDPSAA
jgi:hypothetical protein